MCLHYQCIHSDDDYYVRDRTLCVLCSVTLTISSLPQSHTLQMKSQDGVSHREQRAYQSPGISSTQERDETSLSLSFSVSPLSLSLSLSRSLVLCVFVWCRPGAVLRAVTSLWSLLLCEQTRNRVSIQMNPSERKSNYNHIFNPSVCLKSEM